MIQKKKTLKEFRIICFLNVSFLFRYTMSYLIRTGNSRNNISWGGGTSTKAKYLRRTGTGRNNISWIDINSNSTVNVLERTASGRNNIRWYNTTFSFINYLYGPGDVYADFPDNGPSYRHTIIQLTTGQYLYDAESSYTDWWNKDLRAYSYDHNYYMTCRSYRDDVLLRISEGKDVSGTNSNYPNNLDSWAPSTKGIIVSFPSENVYFAMNVNYNNKRTFSVVSVAYSTSSTFNITKTKLGGTIRTFGYTHGVRCIVCYYTYNVA